MESYLINVLIEFLSHFFLPATLLALLYRLFVNKQMKNVWKGYGVALLLGLLISASGSDTTYKHTTGYDKVQDLKQMRLQRDTENVPEIKDLSRQPAKTKEERKNSFDKMVDYSSDDN